MPNFAIGAVLDLARERQSLKSDYALSKALHCSTQLVANWRHGRNLPDEKRCQLLAELAGLDPFVLVAQMNAQRAKDTDARTFWESLAQRLQLAGAHALAVILSAVVAMGFVAGDAYAASAGGQQASKDAERTVYTSYLAAPGLIWVILLWLASRFDRGFCPVFVPAP